MSKKKNTEEKILNLLISSSFKSNIKTKREKLGESIKRDIYTTYRELEKNDELSVEEMKLLKDCYQAMGDDSVQSLASTLSILAVCISVLSLIVSAVSLVQDLFGGKCEAGINPLMLYAILLFLITLGLLCMIWIIYSSKKIQIISKENARFRNNIVASLILIHEKEENE